MPKLLRPSLTEHESLVIWSALALAADKYDKSAKACWEIQFGPPLADIQSRVTKLLPLDNPQRSNPLSSLAEQFEKQAKDCRDLLEGFEP